MTLVVFLSCCITTTGPPGRRNRPAVRIPALQMGLRFSTGSVRLRHGWSEEQRSEDPRNRRVPGSGSRYAGTSSSCTAGGSGSRVCSTWARRLRLPSRCTMANELILIVEDHEKNRKLVRDVLKFKGYGVIEAETGEEGVRLALEQRPSLVLMDIRLPGIDGRSEEPCRER